jgi:tRNA (mo5U34)-methyltransferase
LNQEFAEALARAGLDEWPPLLEKLLAERFSAAFHGDYPRWAAVVDSLAGLRGDFPRLRNALLTLSPWRKGPFVLAGVRIDAEWRSDLKWARLAGALEPLAGRRILDVGCGNGWYALRMREAGAQFVLGIDPTLLYVMQFLAVGKLADTSGICILPLRLHEIPSAPRVFDTTFSMGVLYHQRNPLEHLRQLLATLRHGGQLVLETIVLPGGELNSWTPPGRYARMRNVWFLPTVPELERWLVRTGFEDLRVVDVTVTNTGEQRRTEWMTFDSLAAALDPADPSRTVEGWPAPRRALFTAVAP